MKQLYCFCGILLIVCFCSSCGVRRYLPDGETLYDGAKVNVELATGVKGKKLIFSKKLADMTSPTRNKKFLGGPYQVWWWYVIGESKKEKKKEKGFRYWLRNKLGKPPVLSSEVNLSLNAENMRLYLENHGHFNSTVTGDTIEKGYKSKAVYQARIQRPYLIGSVGWRLDSSRLSRDIVDLPMDESLLKKGEQYNLDQIKAETGRVNQLLKDKGYFYFRPDDLFAYADTNQDNYTVSLYMGVQENIPRQNKSPFAINNVVALVQDPSDETLPDSLLKAQPSSTDLIIIDSARQFRPSLLSRGITYRPGSLYSLTEQNTSLSRLNSFGVFKFIRTEFRRPDSAKTTDLLDVYYYTNAQKKKRIQLDLGGFTRSNNYTGAELGLNWKNRNLFRGGEVLSVKATGSFEISVNDSLEQNNNWRLGAEVSLLIPKFLAPGMSKKNFKYIPKTRILSSYDWVRRQDLYSEYYLHFRFELNWSDTITRQHRLIPLSLTFYNTGSFTSGFQVSRTRDQKSDFVVPRSVIPSSSYQYSFSRASPNKRNVFNFHAGIETSGAILGLIKGNHGHYSTKVLNSYFMQYVRSDFDFRYVHKLGDQLFWANRVILGMSIPYGNSPFLPFSRQFVIGGANSLRGFLPRQIGPGSTKASTTQQSVYPQVGGDYKLEMNTELRFPMISRLKGAVFLDGGNIWMKDSLLYSVKGQLSKDFIKEIAFDAGFGFRLDITLLIIRIDLGMPLYKPWLEPGDRWVLKDIELGSKSWRKENLVWNIAIGYPF